MALEDWFLSPHERGNPTTRIDRRHADGLAWTRGNDVHPLVHGATYFARLHEVLSAAAAGDSVHFTDWRGDRDERLAGPVTELGDVLADLARRGVAVRGLVWRSHPSMTKFSEEQAIDLSEEVNEAGGQVLLDERVRRGGCHHQKLVVVRHPGRVAEDVAFVGGIDLCHGRRDDARHLGDPQAIDLDRRYGPRPPWHDAQLEIRGPAVGDLDLTFRERWEDPTPLDHRNPLRARIARLVREPRRAGPIPERHEDPPPVPGGTHTVQVLRTYPGKHPPYPFAPRGERSIARAYAKAFARARSFIYIEDQYLWSAQVAGLLARALRRVPDLRVIAVVPRFPDRDGLFSGPPNRIGQEAAIARVRDAGGDRVAVYNLEAETGWPIYVHAKVCVIDDVWLSVGSDNLNRRSWTHDSELSCAIMDETRDDREPLDPGGQGDGARRLARDIRMELWREHLRAEVADEELLDPVAGFDRWHRSAEALDEWHRGEMQGPRPPGRARVHIPVPVPAWAAWWTRPAYRYAVDPDGRPRDLRPRDRY
jgi:phosphatidylserine/phosphatidylglycerophosphate/cardiolipin synthase-like enzyme